MRKHMRNLPIAGAAFTMICLMLLAAHTDTAAANSSTYNTNMYGAKTGLNHALPSDSDPEAASRQPGISSAESTAFKTSFLGQEEHRQGRYPGWLGLFGLLGLLGLRGRSREKS
ncbi:hypothetical protein [Paenibacillus albus]|uniref:MYXO-CTERM domain-containing protein n=1 Tax=Paenibacillus albus TaxID=2495582 RepID=A0A3Q8X564_9BACL|nr:hypothetical protein [Paenibacillus albus]AZN40776.1 hypothetical protein EJC50_14735 [Paenibacillus albus]